MEQLIERIQKLEAAVFPGGQTVPPVVEQPTLTPVPSKIDGPWDPSMGMRHPARPCMRRNKCGPDRRSAAEKASDPYDRNNSLSQKARGETGAVSTPPDPNGPWDKSMGMRHPARPCMKVKNCAPDIRSAAQRSFDPFDTPQGRRDYCNTRAKKAAECNRLHYKFNPRFGTCVKGGYGHTAKSGCSPL